MDLSSGVALLSLDNLFPVTWSLRQIPWTIVEDHFVCEDVECTLGSQQHGALCLFHTSGGIVNGFVLQFPMNIFLVHLSAMIVKHVNLSGKQAQENVNTLP